MKRLLQCVFAVLLLTVQQTWAQDATVIDGISYVLNSEDKTAKVVKPDGASFYGGDIVIPDYVKYDNTDYAVTAIGESAFIEADLTSLQLPKETLKTIDAAAFRDVYGLATIDIPETVTTIGNGAFQCYGLTYLHIPASVTDMGNSAIGGCPELETITVAEGNTHFGVFDGVLMDKAQTRLIVYPAQLEGKKYTVPATVMTIDYKAFRNLAFLTSLTIPASVSELPSELFYKATSLAEINIAPANTAYCSEEGVVYTADMEALVVYPAGKKSKDYTPNTAVKTIGEEAFGYASHLEAVTIPEGVTTIGSAAFTHCTSLRHVSFSESVTTIDINAFYCCDTLETIVLPPHLTKVEATLFYKCKNLRSVTIPAEVTSIGMMAFSQCYKLEEITCLATTPPTATATAFLMLPTAQISLYVPDESVDLYKAAPVWKNFNVQPISATRVISIDNEADAWFSDQQSECGVAFTLDGRKLDSKPTQRGIYIKNGKKIVMK